MGGVGNQLFQLNFCNYLKSKFPDVELKCDLSFYKNYKEETLVNGFHGGFLIQKLPYEIFENSGTRNYIIVKDNKELTELNPRFNYYFEGYWQNKDYLFRSYDFNDFFSSSDISEQNLNLKNLILSKNNSVAVHIRCGDYNNLFGLGNVATRAYYNNAIRSFKEEAPDAYFFVFSNDVNWAKNNLEIHENVYFVDSNNAQIQALWDMYLMSFCKNFIISNSSFSFWAHVFNKNESKVVFTPEYWTNEITTFSKTGESSLQKFYYMKQVSNIPCCSECSEPVLSLFVNENKDFLGVRRFIAAALNQDTTKIKVFVSSRNKKIRQLVQKYSEVNKCVELIDKEQIPAAKKAAKFYAELSVNYYMMQVCARELLLALEKNSNIKELIVPIMTNPQGKTIMKGAKHYKLPVIYSNMAKSADSWTLHAPFLCYVDYNKKDFEALVKMQVKNFIKYILNSVRVMA